MLIESSQHLMSNAEIERLKNQILSELMGLVETYSALILVAIPAKDESRSTIGETIFSGKQSPEDCVGMNLLGGGSTGPLQKGYADESTVDVVVGTVISFIEEVRERVMKIGVVGPEDIEEEVTLWMKQLYLSIGFALWNKQRKVASA